MQECEPKAGRVNSRALRVAVGVSVWPAARTASFTHSRSKGVDRRPLSYRNQIPLRTRVNSFTQSATSLGHSKERSPF